MVTFLKITPPDVEGEISWHAELSNSVDQVPCCEMAEEARSCEHHLWQLLHKYKNVEYQKQVPEQPRFGIEGNPYTMQHNIEHINRLVAYNRRILLAPLVVYEDV